MIRKIGILFFSGLFLLNICGCVAVIAGAAGGAGTSVWLSGKLSQEVNASFDKTLKATRSALKSMKLEVSRETVEKDIAQVMSKYTDGKTIWIDIRPITETSSKVDVRVGAVNGDEEASADILKRIQKYL
ncbi:MAG: DUF3568 family protein [Candidatus Omnitrophota bacterium]